MSKSYKASFARTANEANGTYQRIIKAPEGKAWMSHKSCDACHEAKEHRLREVYRVDMKEQLDDIDDYLELWMEEEG